MRSLWNGSISFGLVNIPVRMYAGTSSNDIKFNYLHSVCNTPIKYQKTCPACQKEVSEDEIVRGYEFQKGQYVVMEDIDFEALALEKTRAIDILDFVELAAIDPVYFQKTYFLEPQETGIKAYHLLRKAMLGKKQLAIAKVIIRSREHLAALRVYSSGLALETMYYPAEIRSIEELVQATTEPTIAERELEMAMMLIDNLTTEFTPEKYQNEYQAMLANAIEQKIAGKEVALTEQPPTAGKVIDLMAALEASVQATKAMSGQTKLPTEQDGPRLMARRKGRPRPETEETG